MIVKWKTILINWINCYTNDNEKREQNITPDNLLNIFTHIHEHIGLDDSKSSKFEANTIQDFIVEKYPGFKFENGTLEATCEEEIYIVASLLLYFICVNSKNAEIKRAMCSRLSAGDQELIMKFSKCLMDCSPILYADVEAAITEACGPDASPTVAETPPALRSLHGEVRRLQAALDAERFDRNYLQEELARTNLKLEKLTKVKEQYKLDILNLKAKISLCCGEKREAYREARADEFIAKLQRQLQDLETRLEDTLSQLEDAQQERDTYKQKVTDLKQERDKWLSVSQQEADRVEQLTDQLDAERRTVATLRDLVSELRQHNRNNGMDSSMLECDDPDTSIQSLSNISVCNEVCANVIEVQLGEERAKIEVLKQQIQSLQEQLTKANQNFESEKLALEAVITEKDSNIINLKQRVNEEENEKSNLKTSYEKEIDLLNKRISEMSGLIKDLEESSKYALVEKVQEIQFLQKDFDNETEKLGKVIKNLQKEVKEQNNLKLQCDEEIIKLNEKIAEISQTFNDVEESLQHEVAEKQEKISRLQQEFAEETEKASNTIRNLQEEMKEQINLKTQFEQDIIVLNNIIVEMSQNLKDTEEKSERLLAEKEQVIQTVQQQFSDETKKCRIFIQELREEIKEQNNIKTRCEKEIAELNNKIGEMSLKIHKVEENSTRLLEEKEKEIQTLHQQQADETQKSNNYITELQEELTKQNNLKTRCEKEIAELNNKIDEMSLEIQNVEEKSTRLLKEKEKEVQTLHQQLADETQKSIDYIKELQEEITKQNNLTTCCEKEIAELNNKIDEMSLEIQNVEENSTRLLEEKEEEVKTLHQQLADETQKSNDYNKQLQEELTKQNNLKTRCEKEIAELNNKIDEMLQEIHKVEENSIRLLKEKEKEIQTLHQQLVDETQKSNNNITELQEELMKQNNLKIRCEKEIAELNNKVDEMSLEIQNIEEKSTRLLQEKEKEVQTLHQQLADETQKSNDYIKELQEEITKQNNLKTHYEQNIIELNNDLVEVSQAMKNAEEKSNLIIKKSKQENILLRQERADETEKSCAIITDLQKRIKQQLEFKTQHEQEIIELNNRIVELAQTIKENKDYSKHLLEEKETSMQILQQQFSNDSEKSDRMINTLQENVKEQINLKYHCEEEIVELKSKIDELSNILKNLEESSEHMLKAKEHEKQALRQQFEAEIKQIEIRNKILEIEILEANNLKKICDQEIASLNSKVDELSQAVQDREESSKLALEDIQQEKNTLQQKLAEETDKSENIIKNLNTEVEAEKHAQQNLKEEFKKHLQEKDTLIVKLEQEVKLLTTCVSTLEKSCEKIIEDNRKEIHSLNQEIDNLNTKAAEKTQSINNLEENSRLALEEKVQEIQSQCQQFSVERDKLKNIIKNLKVELDAEKYAQLKLKEDFDNRIMKLNEKVLNRNNELVELQNNIIQKSELIEMIQSDLRREKELRDELSNTCNHQLSYLNDQKNAIETDLQQKLHEIKELQKQLHGREIHTDKLNKEIENLRTSVSNLEEKCRHRDGIIKEKQKEIEFLNDVYQEEQEKLNHKIDERNASTKSLQMQLQNEIEYKIQLQEELSELKSSKLSLVEELNAAKILMITYEEKTLEWEERKRQLEEQIQGNIIRMVKLEEEKTILSKEIEVIKDIQTGEVKDHEEKIIMLEKQKIEMDNKMQMNILEIKKLEDKKNMLLKEVNELKTTHVEEAKNHQEKTIMWEKQKIELEEQVQANILKVLKLEDEKGTLINEIEDLKKVQIGESKNHEENLIVLEKQMNELKEEIQASNITVDKLETEKAELLDEVEVLKAAQMGQMRDYEESTVTWEKEKMELNGKIETNFVMVKELEVEKAKVLKEIEVLQATRTEDIKSQADNVRKIKELDDKNTLLLNTVEELKTARSEDAKHHEEVKIVWEKQKMELDVKVKNLEDEKVMLETEMEALKTFQIYETKHHEDSILAMEKQMKDLIEQVQTNNLNIEKLEDEKAALLKEIGVLNAAKIEEAKDYEETTLILEKQIRDLKEKILDSVLKVQKLQDEKEMLLKEIETLKTVESGDMKDREEEARTWVQEKTELNNKLRDNVLKIKKLEDEKTMMTKRIEELVGAQTYACFKKEHEEKIQMLEQHEKDLKEQMKADALKVDMLEKEKEMLLKELGALKEAQKEMMAAASQEKITASKHSSWEKEIQAMHQVDTTTSDLAHSSMESLKTISDLEKIIQDKNRKITSMQIEISYIKSIMAESGIKLIDVTKELEVTKDTCHELSAQLKKIVQQKNEEISELKRQVAKMSVTENRASQIIKLSAKYQAMILKRIAEIKSSAVLKELTNFGNQNSNSDELRRSIGSVTMEDLENFLETTDRHLKRCSEKQMTLQKDRDRLTEVNRINESEIINMKKFLTEMSVSFRTFTTVKEVYNQKLSKIVSLQRTVRRDILSLDGRITEPTMCKLERGYAAVMQDLSECAMNLERWVDRSVSRMLSAEKIKQAFTSDLEQASLSTGSYQNAAVEVQLSELENSFQKLLAEIDRAQKGEGAKSAQEITIMEVRAEYEDKLNRMKAKMKELFHEEMGRLKQKQADEIAILERELVKCKERMAESSKAYEEHIRALTTELWSVGEKFLVKQEEADWLRKKQSGSLMSLQHVHSSGLHNHGHAQEMFGRPSDTHSLRSLPVQNKKTEARGLHMSDEEGEVFDNRFLKELSATPRASLAPGQRISELKRRNSLVPPHLKSSYPAEMQFAPTLDEEDIKCASTSFSMGRQRKEVGITAYKKPGPPTPSKQAGRLSATDCELRESLRVEADPGRKTSTPSRIRSLFRSHRHDTDAVTPRSRRFSNMFRKK